MKLRVIECEQRSDQWRAARCGRLTGSVAESILKAGRGGKESQMRVTLREQLVAERLTGHQLDNDFDTRALAHGREKEPYANARWEAETGLILQSTGFVICDDMMVGCSLDSHVGPLLDLNNPVFEGVLESKCPGPKMHVKYLKGGVVPEDYLPQLRHNVWLTGAQWGEFVSFDDRFPETLQMFRVRMTREELEVEEYEAEVRRFLAEVNVDLAAIQQRKAA